MNKIFKFLILSLSISVTLYALVVYSFLELGVAVHPGIDRNPQKFMNIYEAKDSDFKKATIRIYHDASVIQLPVLKN